MIAAETGNVMSRTAHSARPGRLPLPEDDPAGEDDVLARERHLLRELVRREPRELRDVVRGLRLAVAPQEPREPEHVVAVVRVDVRPEPLERLDLQPRLLA